MIRLPAAVATLCLVAACGGAAPPSAAPPTARGPSGVVEDFMRAVTDSNLTRMAQLWGTSRGPANETHTPSDYAKRIAIIQAYLRGGKSTVAQEMGMAPDRHSVVVAFDRDGCVRNLPFTLVRYRETWLITTIELNAVGAPGRSCQTGGPPPPS